MQKHILGLLFFLLGVLCVAAECRAQAYISLHSLTGGKTNLVSPDKKYRASYTLGDASLPDAFRILKNDGHDQRPTSLLHSERIYKIRGFFWLPERRHTLVFSVKYLSGESLVALWQPQHQVRVLFHGQLPSNQDPDGEYIQLLGLSRDHHSLVIEHHRDWLPKNMIIVRSIRLPRRLPKD